MYRYEEHTPSKYNPKKLAKIEASLCQESYLSTTVHTKPMEGKLVLAEDCVRKAPFHLNSPGEVVVLNLGVAP